MKSFKPPSNLERADSDIQMKISLNAIKASCKNLASRLNFGTFSLLIMMPTIQYILGFCKRNVQC